LLPTDRQRFAHSPCPGTGTVPTRHASHYGCLRYKVSRRDPLDSRRSPSPIAGAIRSPKSADGKRGSSRLGDQVLALATGKTQQ
jgi:hypothetical protein